MPARLQQLPWNVMALVLSHLMAGNQLRYHRTDSLDCEQFRRFTALLHTCRTWRHLAIRRFARTLKLSVDCAPPALTTTLAYWPTTLAHPQNEHRELVQTVTMELDFWSILNGRASALLAASPHTYTCARRLNIRFGQCEVEHEDHASEGPVIRVERFMRDVRRIMPRLRTVCIDHTVNYDIGNQDFYLAYTTLITRAFNIHEPAIRPLPVGPQLTSLTFAWNIYYLNTACLLHLCAPTLQTLYLTFNHLDNVRLLVATETGKPVAYPKLEKLSLSCWYYLDPGSRPTTNPKSMPFPALRSIYMYMDYPFADDTLFRGNHRTLEYLSMNITSSLIKISQAHKLFRSTRFAKLKAVRVKNMNIYRMQPDIPSKVAIDFALAINPTRVQTLVIEDVTMQASLMPSMLKHGQLACLQRLIVPDAFLTLANMVMLLKILPALVELHCQCAGLGPQLESLNDHKLLDTFKAYGNCLHNYFEFLQLGHWGNADIDVLAKCATLLAISCPQFTFLAVSGHMRAKLDTL
ncbi:hypothetical protein IWW52_001871 [Coemansia sp. RSA 2704]|nr:hypothetical protein IWW52_001871 [Coemansia sp. RSA 2704]